MSNKKTGCSPTNQRPVASFTSPPATSQIAGSSWGLDTTASLRITKGQYRETDNCAHFRSSWDLLDAPASLQRTKDLPVVSIMEAVTPNWQPGAEACTAVGYPALTNKSATSDLLPCSRAVLTLTLWLCLRCRRSS